MASNVPMPSAPTEEAVARMLYDGAPKCVLYDWGHAKAHARAVLALVEKKVREGAIASYRYCGREAYIVEVNAIVASVMGKEAP